MEKILLVTQNAHKVEEIGKILKSIGFEGEVLALPEEYKGVDIPETGESFEENAAQKAYFLAEKFKDCYILSDDSGLCVDALGGAPGIYSARFGGKEASYEARFALLHQQLEEVKAKDYKAYFVCVLALVLPLEEGQSERDCLFFRGEVHGEIAQQARGLDGFGYDPIFYLRERGCTMAEITAEEKNKISHRAKALEQLAQYFKNRNENKSC